MNSPDDLASTLAGWRETEQAAARGPWKPAYRTWTEHTDERCAEARIHDYDGTPVAITYLSGLLEAGDADETEQFIVTARTAMPLLLAAIEAVLKAADEAEEVRDYSGYETNGRLVGWRLNPAKVRETIATALTGKET